MTGARLRHLFNIPLIGGILIIMIISGCVKHTEGYQSVKLSSEIPTNDSSAKNPVIIIHGLFGAELFSADNENIWGKFSYQRILDKKILLQLAFSPLRVGSIMMHAEIAPGNVPVYRLKNYSLLLNALKKFGYSEKNLFIFAYDWRQSVPENAIEFHKFILEKSKYFPAGQKFDIIAHSMGGLISRYYLQYGPQQLPAGGLPALSNEGSDHVEKLFVFGTPNCGYADTVLELCNGLAFVQGSAKYRPALLGTFKSYFCMLPHPGANAFIYSDDGSSVDIYDIETWKKLNWGLASAKSDTLFFRTHNDALKCLAKNLSLGRQFANAMHKPMPRKKNLKLYLFAGNAFDTVSQCSVNRKTGKITAAKYAPGDGKILFKSAFGHALIPWDGIYLFGASHMGLFISNEALRNLDFLLQKEPDDE
ncbi:MAG: hypothetical protein IKA22_07550 [Lentisphaeria bacterium]|nr:hypothetical protein [Lentisphaeria bacterium]